MPRSRWGFQLDGQPFVPSLHWSQGPGTHSGGILYQTRTLEVLPTGDAFPARVWLCVIPFGLIQETMARTSDFLLCCIRMGMRGSFGSLPRNGAVKTLRQFDSLSSAWINLKNSMIPFKMMSTQARFHECSSEGHLVGCRLLVFRDPSAGDSQLSLTGRRPAKPY